MNAIDILVVDDQIDQAASLDQILDGLGCRLEFAISGEEALSKIHSRPYALVLLDVMMPGMDGFQTATRIRERSETRLIPIIFLTGSRTARAQVAQAYSAGAVDYLFKPVDPALLRSKVQVFVELFRTARELELQQERSRIFAEMTSDYTAVLTGAGGRFTLVEANEALVRTSGYRVEELRAMDWRTLVAAEDVAAAEDAMRGLIAGQEVRAVVRVRSRDGRLRSVEVYARPVFDPSSSVTPRIYIAAQDRTAQRRLEDELRQSQKMDAIGRLAGGVAHDFNNMLTVILGQCQVLLERCTEEEDRESLTEISGAAERSAQLTRRLLAFSRKQVTARRVLDINAVVHAVVPMLRRLVGEQVQIELALDERAGRVCADPSQLEQVIMNLVVNSRDAMPAGGTITIRTAGVELDGSPEQPHAARGRHVLLAVTDTGRGMDEATRARLFEPFFTTKAPGAGTGLGLSTVHGIVTQSRGRITVTSEPGRGTEVRIDLPATPGVESERQTLPGRIPTDAGGSETVLVVEDEAAIRKLVRLALEPAGYRVLLAEDGAEAERMAREAERPIDLVVTDVVMPGMNGIEVYAAVRALHPRARVLYVSGYADVMQSGIVEAGLSFLPKPFCPKTLCSSVRGVLDADPPAARSRG